MMLQTNFFNQDALEVAKQLLGKVIQVRYQDQWLSVRIIETEAYYCEDKASHASLGFTEKRKALFMPSGTIYMYYARGGDSLNVSCRGAGNAVLIKSGVPYLEGANFKKMIRTMQRLNPVKNTQRIRPQEKLCSGQTLLCKSLGLTVKIWDQRSFEREIFFIEDVGYQPSRVIQTRRLGIPQHRDPNLFYRFIDYEFAQHCTQNPLKKRSLLRDLDYFILDSTSIR